LRAPPGVPAGAAGEVRGPAPTVDQHDRLAGLPRHLSEGGPGAVMEGSRDPAPHVDDLDRRKLPPVDAAGELQPVQGVPALRPWRSAAAEQDGAGPGGTAAGDLACVVARIALLLVGGVVLLVDHDQTWVGDRREDGGARPDADPRLARAQPPPL